MDTIEKLFESAARAKLLKLFLMNPDMDFSAEDAARQAKIRPRQFNGEVKRLLKLGIARNGATKLIALAPSKSRKKSRPVTVKTFSANNEFPLFAELRMLMLKSAPHAKGHLAAKIKRLGNIKLAILAGVFIDSPSSRADMLMVGDGFNKSRIKSFIQWLESEVGKELNYVVMSTQEFKYRMDMYDRFVRDILEFPHETVINRLGV